MRRRRHACDRCHRYDNALRGSNPVPHALPAHVGEVHRWAVFVLTWGHDRALLQLPPFGLPEIIRIEYLHVSR
jgi:hypothetical protein